MSFTIQKPIKTKLVRKINCIDHNRIHLVYIPTDWVLFLGIKKGQHVQLILDGNAKNFLVEPLKDLPTSPETEPKVKEKEVKS